MRFTASPRLIRIFLSSPGDVADERGIARTVIKRLGDDPLLRDRVICQVIAWDDPSSRTPILATLTPQEAINQGLPKPSECDIVVVIFWSRMGIPLPDDYKKKDGSRYLSGTEWEYEDAVQAARGTGKPLVVIYRRMEKVLLDDEALDYANKLEQKKRVREFFEQFTAPSGTIIGDYNLYQTPGNFRKALENDLKVLIQRVLDKPDKTAPSVTIPAAEIKPGWPAGQSPFPGLHPFTPNDVDIFFGRGKETDALLKKVADSRFVAVVGASGSGKSSLVGAGLIPRLKDNAIPGSKDWRWVRFTPGEMGDNPFLALATALKQDWQRPVDLAKALAADPAVLSSVIQHTLKGCSEWTELLLFMDQFEELFTTVNPSYRDGFVALLETAAKMDRLRTIATLRADFTHRCIEQPALARLFNEGTFMLAAPERSALYEMITRPAAVARLVYEDDLAWRILDDTGTDPGALALLAYTLDELYQVCCRNGRLSHVDYEKLGGVRGSIGTRAENIFAELDPEVQTVLPYVLRELVEVDERGTATRQRAPLARFENNTPAWTLLERFTDARLLTTNDHSGMATIEVSHEALFRSWPRLAGWIETAQDDLRLLRQVRLAAEEWEDLKRNKAYRWPHERLTLVYAMLDRLQQALDETTRDFIRPECDRLIEEINDPAPPHFRRAAIGDRLNEIGDTRPGVGLQPDGLPDIVWCDVPGGKMTLEDNAGTFIVAPVQIAKYPVTYAQYRVFLDAPDGYCNADWWGGLAAREDEPGQQNRPNPNHPAENVSWYDAAAFCRWLSAKFGEEIRLPTEWEWQQAATGGNPAKEYPWESNWDNGTRCNTYESGLSRTIAVGMYPRVAAPVGALDMSGNVFEWCLNEYESATNMDVSGDARRVVRGGSWYNKQDYARAAYRGRFNPDFRDNHVGFRLVCIPYLPKTSSTEKTGPDGFSTNA